MSKVKHPRASPSGRKPLPPRSDGIPLLGALPYVLKGQIGYIVRARATHGDIYTLDLGLTKLIALNHPRHAQHVLRDHARNYHKGGIISASLRKVLGNGLPVSEGEIWRRQRRMIQPQFHKDRLAAMTELMVIAIDDCLTSWDTIHAVPERKTKMHPAATLQPGNGVWGRIERRHGSSPT